MSKKIQIEKQIKLLTDEMHKVLKNEDILNNDKVKNLSEQLDALLIKYNSIGKEEKP